jgi:hypothetical protein
VLYLDIRSWQIHMGKWEMSKDPVGLIQLTEGLCPHLHGVPTQIIAVNKDGDDSFAVPDANERALRTGNAVQGYAFSEDRVWGQLMEFVNRLRSGISH